MTKQETLFCLALEERDEVLTNTAPGKLVINHARGFNRYAGEKYNIIFPRSFVEQAIKLHTVNKRYSYNFIGAPSNNREWVKDYSGFIRFSKDGRRFPKNKFDGVDYYNHIANSKFTLCPAGCDANYTTGNFIWTYRFIEATMCKSIPIIQERDFIPDKMGGFVYYLPDQEHLYDEDIVNLNFNLFLKRYTL